MPGRSDNADHENVFPDLTLGSGDETDEDEPSRKSEFRTLGLKKPGVEPNRFLGHAQCIGLGVVPIGKLCALEEGWAMSIMRRAARISLVVTPKP